MTIDVTKRLLQDRLVWEEHGKGPKSGFKILQSVVLLDAGHAWEKWTRFSMHHNSQ